jgi:hypothetical protein
MLSLYYIHFSSKRTRSEQCALRGFDLIASIGVVETKLSKGEARRTTRSTGTCFFSRAQTFDVYRGYRESSFKSSFTANWRSE